jgi:hypothetical protein
LRSDWLRDVLEWARPGLPFRSKFVLAEFRAGNHAQALLWLEKFTARTQQHGPAGVTYAPYFALGHSAISLTQFRQGDRIKAAGALSKAQKLIDDSMPTGKPDRPLNNDWDDWLRARLLVREAESALQP